MCRDNLLNITVSESLNFFPARLFCRTRSSICSLRRSTYVVMAARSVAYCLILLDLLVLSIAMVTVSGIHGGFVDILH